MQEPISACTSGTFPSLSPHGQSGTVGCKRGPDRELNPGPLPFTLGPAWAKVTRSSTQLPGATKPEGRIMLLDHQAIINASWWNGHHIPGQNTCLLGHSAFRSVTLAWSSQQLVPSKGARSAFVLVVHHLQHWGWFIIPRGGQRGLEGAGRAGGQQGYKSQKR